MRVVASDELLNKVKYRNKDSGWMLDVHFFSSCRAPISIRQDYSAFRRVKTLKDGGLFPASPSYLRGLI
jgi:hypothetical protein